MCGLARGVGEMVVFRLLQGAAGAAMIPLSQAILIETFPPDEHTLAMTTFGMGLMAAPVLGPTLGGWITLNWSWRWIFFINVPTGVVAMLMVYAFVHDPPYLRRQRGGGRIDYFGIILVARGAGTFSNRACRWAGATDGLPRRGCVMPACCPRFRRSRSYSTSCAFPNRLSISGCSRFLASRSPWRSFRFRRWRCSASTC